jgi:type IX secretion system PorP/SprF family membrane protein
MPMRFLTILLFWCCVLPSLFAQQEEQFTQFMHYKLGLNPAYAGAAGGISFAALTRNQWLGLNGAPQTQLVSFSMPAWGENVGLGANILRQTIGVSSNYSLETAYSYRIPAPRGYLNLGLQASARMIRTDFSKLNGTQPIEQDPVLPTTLQSRLVPNFGAGLYYYTDNFYMGVSVPRLIQNNIDLNDDGGIISREVRHTYLMTGFIVTLSDVIKLQPQALFKYVQGTPFDADINASLIFMDKFITGISYRTGGSKEKGLGESVSLMFSAQVAGRMLAGFSYDASLSELRRYSNGSLEVVLRFFLEGKAASPGTSVDDPRFFF